MVYTERSAQDAVGTRQATVDNNNLASLQCLGIKKMVRDR